MLPSIGISQGTISLFFMHGGQ